MAVGMTSLSATVDPTDTDINELMEVVHDAYGYDFRSYADTFRRRRVSSFLEEEEIDTVPEVTKRVRTDKQLFERLLSHLSISTTELFRDPGFYRDFARLVVPVLSTYERFRIWHAGCSTGEEVYSMAILLQEHGLLERATLYATDIDRTALGQAKRGIVRSSLLKRYSINYFQAGMRGSLQDYWHTRHGHSLLNPDLLSNVVFCEHNLATDTGFGEMHVIACRNVLIYFNRALQRRVSKLLCQSLAPRGFMCLGAKESTRFSGIGRALEILSAESRIYRGRQEASRRKSGA
jgi:chemotaxis protein methyltransferase CheR